MLLEKYLDYLMNKEGSDLHIKIGNRPSIRINGKIEFIEETSKILPQDMNEITLPLLSPARKAELEKTLNSDFSYSVPGKGRFRLNLSYQRGSLMLVARKISENISKIEELGLPTILRDIVLEKRGLVLVTGATGSGKSTTVSAMIQYINENYYKNIITFEDPIEYLFKDEKSLISQKEIPSDIKDFSSALKYVLRQDPDIIFIGELRDKETIEAAIRAAETGHLVISTLHTVNASQTISRIIDFYDTENHKQIRHQLSSNLKAVVSQRLLVSKDKKSRVAAVEILRNSPLIKEHMLSSEGEKKIPEAIKSGTDVHGMQSFDQAIEKIFLEGKISYDVALEAATVKTDIQLLKTGIVSGGISDFYSDMLDE